MPATTRLAPSPTGALHLGNARTFLVNWLLARQLGWHVTLRIDDLDGPRIKPNADQQAMQDLGWMGIDWDSGPVYQSQRSASYITAIETLLDSDRAYCCTCSRKDVSAAASAPHSDDGATVYPGTCRGRWPTREAAIEATGRGPAIRLRLDQTEMTFTDSFAGPQVFDPARQLGDFVIGKSDGVAAYQLASVVDDAAAGVTAVVRGDDLLDSTPRQMAIYDGLGLSPRVESYYHLPLIVGLDGRRLAKRHGDTRVAAYRAAGVGPGRLLALLARWCGIDTARETTVDELIQRFDINRMPRGPITFTAEDDRWLRAGVA